MMQQYNALRDKYKDCLLFFRVGDFYEMFFDDAVLVSRELELTLTGKECGLEERAPMCGVPFHAVSTYVERLLQKGYKVAIGEQMEDPATAKGLVERDVVRIYTPGTVNDPAMLDEKANSFLLSVYLQDKNCALSYTDVSTGEFYVRPVDDLKKLRDEVASIHPSEMITNRLEQLSGLLGDGATSGDWVISEQSASWFQFSNAEEKLQQHFSVKTLSSLGLSEEDRGLVCAAGALMKYLEETQKNSMEHINHISLSSGHGVMLLDRNTRRNLELTESMRTRSRKGSLLWLLDKTGTAMGSRLLRSWIEEPLTEKSAIEGRLSAVDALFRSPVLSERLFEQLRDVYDLERLLSKVSYHSLNARDCLALQSSLSRIPDIKKLLDGVESEKVQALNGHLNPLSDLCDLLLRAIHPDAPQTITDGGIIREGYSQQLDELREASTSGKNWIMSMEAKEREETGIKNLRIQYNKVFGYYIEVTKSFLSLVPDRYIRKQTLTNAERYMTPELKEMEQKILGAQEQSVRLEMQLFDEIRTKLSQEIPSIQATAQAVKELDALLSLSRVARENHYVRPDIREDGVLEITGGRHPVVEQTVKEGFVPNDTSMNQEEARMLIITGPNMAGKSTYMRQVALITLMAHIGSFVPADTASIPVVDRIFTRVGASDDLFSGQSTFMVEMAECAYILRNATPKSLVILDEIGRGTSTFDGLSIAWAVVEYLLDAQHGGCKTLFATHYHELSELEGHLQGVQNYCVSVKEHGEDVIFLRKIVRGGADRSFGIHVARLAGVPHEVLVRAHEIQARLEVSQINQETIGQNILGGESEHREEQVDLFDYQKTEIIEELQSIDVMALTPMDAINKLFLLREKARKL
ncbi:MAG: DNA mismatch repair protein MutS [Clostridia bacterium]|nr:DNA mismatch repair protein MutS [Clostridia bacterium]